MPSTLDWLRSRTDAQLSELLAARPDLLVPAPGNLTALARRLESPTTARRALERLDAFELQVLQALLALEAVRHPAAPDRIAEFLGGPATAQDVGRAADRLEALALARSDGPPGDTAAAAGSHRASNAPVAAAGTPTAGDGAPRNTPAGANTPVGANNASRGYRITTAARDALGPYPGGLGPPSGLEPNRVAAALDTAGPAGRALLDRLSAGTPVGVVEPGSPHAATVAELVNVGLLSRIDEYTVLMPREVGIALRGQHPLGPAEPAAPRMPVTAHGTSVVDGTAAGQALAAHGRMARLLEIFGSTTIPALKSEGIGILVVRRLARQLELTEHLVALYLELLAQSGLIASVQARAGQRPGSAASWVPTQAADAFLAGTEAAGWALLATGWLQMRRDPTRVGIRDQAGKVSNVLAHELDWRTGPAERHRVLAELAALDPGDGADRDTLVRRLAFRSPSRDRAVLAGRVDSVLTEATELGVVAFDGLSTAGRAVLDDDVERAAAAMGAALPQTVDSILVQADMTVVAPGRLAPELAAALARAADVESAGGATVYRVSESSVRRALDAGATSDELHELFEKHSATPIPQSMTYLIDDVARRHGVLRAGGATAYLRSEDPTLVAQAVAAVAGSGIILRRLAPTVAVTGTELPVLMDALRAAGLAPAAEDASGTVLDLRPRPRRTRITLPPRPFYREPSPPSAEQIAGLVRRMRADDGALAETQDTAEVLAVLREASRSRSGVWIGYADAEGGTSRRVVEPVVVSGGSLLAFDRMRRSVRTFAVARISSAHPEAGA